MLRATPEEMSLASVSAPVTFSSGTDRLLIAALTDPAASSQRLRVGMSRA